MRNVGNIAIRTAPENSGSCFKLGEWIWFGATDGVNDYREFCHEFKTGSQQFFLKNLSFSHCLFLKFD